MARRPSNEQQSNPIRRVIRTQPADLSQPVDGEFAAFVVFEYSTRSALLPGGSHVVVGDGRLEFLEGIGVIHGMVQ
jgi:hypothetical protein